MHINWKKEILTIPNLLSVFRLALIPVYITIYLNAVEPCDYYLAAGILALSCSTDMIDGYIATIGLPQVIVPKMILLKQF